MKHYANFVNNKEKMKKNILIFSFYRSPRLTNGIRRCISILKASLTSLDEAIRTLPINYVDIELIKQPLPKTYGLLEAMIAQTFPIYYTIL